MRDNDLPVLFYDGGCGLCSRSVRFLMRRDRSDFLYYAPLQGETAKERLNAELRQSLSTVVYQRPDGQVFVRSDAVLWALIDIKSHWRFAAKPALLLPKSWRDGIYNWIAARRKKFFPKNSCPLPNPMESDRILT